MGQEEKPQEETEDDPQPGGDPPTGVIPKRKRRRLDMKKVDQSKIVDIKSLPANPLQEVPFAKQPALQVKVFVGNKVYVANTGDKDVTIPVGTFLCGYGKGRFAANNNGSFNPDCHHMYNIKTCDDFVFTTKMTTVKEVVAEQRSNNPEAMLPTTPCSTLPARTRMPSVSSRTTRSSSSLRSPAKRRGDRTSESRRALWLGSSRPIPSRAHTASCRHGPSSGDPRVWALSVRWSSSINRATSPLERPCP